MELRGLVVTQVGSGTYIASTEEQTAESEEERLVRVSVEEFVEKMTDLGVERDRLCRMIEAEYRNKAGKHGIKRNKNT
jgi:DNA-binding transcriptional regulator YhcF (GntR family)